MKHDIKIDAKNFEDGDVVQFCPHCKWQTPGTQAAVSKCPECMTSVIPVLRVEKKAVKPEAKPAPEAKKEPAAKKAPAAKKGPAAKKAPKAK